MGIALNDLHGLFNLIFTRHWQVTLLYMWENWDTENKLCIYAVYLVESGRADLESLCLSKSNVHSSQNTALFIFMSGSSQDKL